LAVINALRIKQLFNPLFFCLMKVLLFKPFRVGGNEGVFPYLVRIMTKAQKTVAIYARVSTDKGLGLIFGLIIMTRPSRIQNSNGKRDAGNKLKNLLDQFIAIFMRNIPRIIT